MFSDDRDKGYILIPFEITMAKERSTPGLCEKAAIPWSDLLIRSIVSSTLPLQYKENSNCYLTIIYHVTV